MEAITESKLTEDEFMILHALLEKSKEDLQNATADDMKPIILDGTAGLILEFMNKIVEERPNDQRAKDTLLYMESKVNEVSQRALEKTRRESFVIIETIKIKLNLLKSEML